MSKDLRGQLSEVGPPAEGVVGDLPVARSSKPPMMLAMLIVVVGGGYALLAGRNTAPDQARLGMTAAIDRPADVVPRADLVPAPQAMSQPAMPPIQAAPGSAQIASDIGAASLAGRIEQTPITATKAMAGTDKGATGTKAVTKAGTVPATVVAHSGATAKTPTAQIDEIGITEE